MCGDFLLGVYRNLSGDFHYDSAEVKVRAIVICCIYLLAYTHRLLEDLFKIGI
jgi:hypothetical protein